MRGENQAGPLFTIINCVDVWMIALKLDHFVFTSLYSNDCISGCMYPNEIRLKSLYLDIITLEGKIEYNSDLVYLQKYLYHFLNSPRSHQMPDFCLNLSPAHVSRLARINYTNTSNKKDFS